MKSSSAPFHKPTLAAAILPAILAVFCFALAALPARAATTNFLNAASVASGGSYGLDNPYWNTTSETATPLADLVAGDSVTIGGNPSDFNGYAFSIPFNYSASTHFTGSGSVVAIYATNVVVTFDGADNNYLDGATTFYVAPGSTLIDDVNWNSLGLNFDNQTVSLTGGGTVTFQTEMGVNSTGAITQNMPGGTNNLAAGKTATDPFTGGYTLTAGTLNFTTTASATAFSGFATKGFNINGPVVIDNTSGAPLAGGLGTATNTLGASFTFNGSSSLDFGTAPWTNTASHSVTVLANTLAIGGGISGPGSGLTKLGNGTLLLYGASTYTGGTLVYGGTLAFTNAGSLAGGSQIIVSNATLDFSGETGSYAAAAAISLTNSTLNLSNTLVTALSTLSLTNVTLDISELSAGSVNLNATNLNVGGAANVINITSLPLVTSYNQTFHLIKGATVTGALNFTLGALPVSASTAYAGYITNIAASGAVNLVLTAGPAPVRSLTWSGLDGGAPSGAWDVGGTPTWLDASHNPTTFDELDFVTFNDTATGQTTVNLGGDLTPTTLTVSNNTAPYTFAGGALNDGSGSLTLNKQGAGTLTLQENGDEFTGGINVSGGTVIVDNNSSGITGGATIGAGATLQLGSNDTSDQLPSGTVTVNGTLTLDCADTPAVSNPLAGNGLVEQLNTNLVILAGSSSGTWSVLIENGTLQAANNAALGSLPGGAVTITNGGTFDLGGNTAINNADFGAKQFNIAGAGVGGNGAIVNSYNANQEDAFENIVLTANATLGGAIRWDLRNGTPLLNLNGYTLTKTNANQISAVSTHVTSGNIVIQQGVLSFESTPNFDASAGTITVNPGGTLGQYEDTLGSFTRAIVLNGGTNENLSAAGSNTVAFLDAPILLTANSTLLTFTYGAKEIINGVISDGGAGFGVTSTGYGTNWLAATNTYSGATIAAEGVLALTNRGSIASSALILVTNYATFDVSGLNIPFSSLMLGDDTLGAGYFNLGSTLMTNFNYLSLSNATLQVAVADAGVPCITVTNLNLGDGGANSLINITALPVTLPSQFPLIKYGTVTGAYNVYLSAVPPGYNCSLVNNTANHSIDLLITQQPPGRWNGGDSVNNANDWSDAVNWNGEGLTGSDALFFAGTAGLNNTNDTSETPNSITFIPGAGAFTLNGNPVALNGGITNNSASTQTIDLGLSFGGSVANLSLNGGSSTAASLIIGGGLTNTADLAPGYTTLTLTGTGVLTNLLNSTASPGGTNSITLPSSTASWTLLDNSAATPITVPWEFNLEAGTFTFGNAGSAPNLNSTTVNGAPLDNQLGDVSGAVATFNMVNGTLTTAARLNSALATSSTGMVSQVGGTLNIGSQFQGANGSTSNAVSIVTISGGTMNIGGVAPFGPFYNASRDQGTLTLSGSGSLNCSYLDVSRDANGTTRGSIGIVNLNGGTLATARVGAAIANAQAGPPSSGVNPTATFNFNGGMLTATTNAANFYQGSTVAPVIPITSIVKIGGAVINDGGFAIAVLEPLQHDSTLGATNDGGLTKLGTGNLTLASASTYTGHTLVSAGTLTVNGSLGATAVMVTNTATLSGTGSLGGSVIVAGGGTIAPGAVGVLGNLTVAGTVSLQGTTAMDLNESTLTNDVLAAGSLTYGGTLAVTNLAGPLASGNTFKLFNAATYSGAFAAIVPATPGAGLLWNTNTLNTGVLSVISGAKPIPVFTSLGVNGATLTIMATNGAAGGQYVLLGATNLTLPFSQWTPVLTNSFDGSGKLNLSTNIINPALPQEFFIITQ